MENRAPERNVLVIGAGIFGLVTAKTLAHDSNGFFDSVTIFEKNSEVGGVWASNRIYNGLTTNSPLLTYEIPGFPYPEELRKCGQHVKAQDVNSYFRQYAEEYKLTERTRFQTHVEEVTWDSKAGLWLVKGVDLEHKFCDQFTHIVICTGLYHARNMPFGADQTSKFDGNIWHSSDIAMPDVQETLATCKSVAIIGAGKSAIDLAALIAQGLLFENGNKAPPAVSLVYRRPHWLSPRKMVRNTIPFESILFSRFVNAWLPYASPPNYFHYLIAETSFGKWCTDQIFKVISTDFIRSLGQQDLPKTIPDHPLRVALSGALHVEPPGYLQCVRDGRIEIFEASIDTLRGQEIHLRTKDNSIEVIEADSVICATGYNLDLAFFSADLLREMGLVKEFDPIDDVNNLPYVRLWRLIVPPKTTHHRFDDAGHSQPYRNIAMNGFGYSLLTPTTALVAANWISEYFTKGLEPPPQVKVENDIDEFISWQSKHFGRQGAKGVHIGPHATLYTDELLSDMGLQSGHVNGAWTPWGALKEWFRPMYPAIYADVVSDRRKKADRKLAHEDF